MKKLTIIIFIVVLLTMFFGCSQNDSKQPAVSYSQNLPATNSQAPIPPPSKAQTSENNANNSTPADSANFSIEGKWKSIGDYGFGQAQPGSIVIFDGMNCNYFSPQDTYAFYKSGNDYVLDTTSVLFSQNITHIVTMKSNDLIEVHYGSTVTVLQRVG